MGDQHVPRSLDPPMLAECINVKRENNMPHFRYMIPKSVFEKITALCKDSKLGSISWGQMYAERKESFAVVTNFEVNETLSENEGHERPHSWMKLKKTKIKTTRKLKEEQGYDIVWEFHTHPSGSSDLHEIDLKILNYLSVGVMVIVTSKDVVGWYYDKRSTKKPIIEKMIYEVIDDL